MDSITVPVAAWATWGFGEGGGDEQLDLAFIDPASRRRLSSLDRIALSVARSCMPEKGIPIRMVFASRHGELARCATLLAEIASSDLPSPMAFSQSVLNAIPGIYSIARHDRSPTTAISAEEDTFPLAMVEAAAQTWQDAGTAVLVVCADDPPPSIYTDLVQSPSRPTAIAVRLEAAHAMLTVRCSWMPVEGETDRADAADAFLACLGHGKLVRWNGRNHLWQWQRNDLQA